MSAPLLRRNGKPRSCEPCRVSKIRCDHAEPVCQKCRVRGVAAQCFYHPAPMTKPAGTPRKPPEPRRRVKPRYSDARESGDHAEVERVCLSSTILRNDTVNVDSSAHVRNARPTPPESTTRTTSTFYLGSTSYASVFAEEGPIPDSMHPDVDHPARTPISDIGDASSPAWQPRRVTGHRFCQVGVGQYIVSKLEPFSLFEELVRMYFDNIKSSYLPEPLVMLALPQLRADLECLSKAGSNIHEAYAQITRNTAQPLKVPSTMVASEFHTLHTGRNLRWETLGLVLTIAGCNAQYISPDDPVFTQHGRKIDRGRFIEDMIHASDECISLCQIHGAVNDIVVWLIYHNGIANSDFYGDNHHSVWHRMSESAAAMYAEGIHREDNFDEPFFLRESRRRVYRSMYKSDKLMAMFVGRPPLMGRRYGNRKQPLDVDDCVLKADPSDIELALSKLDSEGWNTEGKIYPASWIRLRYLLSVFKERVLEHSLAGEPDHNVVEQLQAISADMKQTWDAVPAHLRYDLYAGDSAWTSLDGVITIRLISAYLEYLCTEFQIQRILRRETKLAIPGLLDISMRILQTILVFNKQRSQAYTVQRHFSSLILFCGFGSAGVLALELRRCTREQVPLPGNISRAEVIRNLSVLISCLEWVILPGDGNSKLCIELNKMLEFVLDEVLNYQPPSNESRNDAHGDLGTMGDGVFDMPLIEGMEPIPMESEDFLNWLDNANWNNTYLF